jgi:hypothetical protein
MEIETDFSNLHIAFRTYRCNMRPKKNERLRDVLGGFASYKEGMPIYIGFVGTRIEDKIERLSIEEIISHETVHQLIAIMVGPNESNDMDAMVQERTYLDGYRVYIQKNKIIL